MDLLLGVTPEVGGQQGSGGGVPQADLGDGPHGHLPEAAQPVHGPRRSRLFAVLVLAPGRRGRAGPYAPRVYFVWLRPAYFFGEHVSLLVIAG